MAKARSFDHSSIASLPEYQEAARALTKLAMALDQAMLEAQDDPEAAPVMDREAFIAAMGDLTWAIPYMDMTPDETCPQCREIYEGFAAARIESSHNGVRAYYECAHGRHWDTGWAVELPML